MNPIVVQKFGGSVLRGPEALRDVVEAISRTLGGGRSVVAVVSAFEGTTDSIIARARTVAEKPEAEALDLVLATGEIESAALLTLALVEAGVRASVLNPFQIGIETDGAHGAARVRRVDVGALRARLAAGPAIVVPGFIGRGPNGALTTLGRGGSDLSAVAIASELRAEACELVKDVAGYFSADPARVSGAVHREEVALEEALFLARHGNDLLQERALEWAARDGVRVVVRALGADRRRTEIVREPPAGDRPGVVSIALRNGGGDAHAALVGPRPPGEDDVRAALGSAGVSLRRFERAPSRAVAAVAASDGARALAALHERFVVFANHSSKKER